VGGCRRVFEMTLDRGEFLRLLPAAVGHETFTEEAGELVHRDRDRPWRIRLAPLPPLALGPIPLARLRVELVFEGWNPDLVEKFMDRFFQYFQRGGG